MPQNFHIDQARCLKGNTVKSFCKLNNINKITAAANNHPASGLVERLIQILNA